MEKIVPDYNVKLEKDYETIRDKIKRGMLPLVARNPAINKAVTEYVDAQTDYFDEKRARGAHPPIQLRNSQMLSKFANLVMYEELKWSHPDKMSIVDYPIMSDAQESARQDKYRPNSDLQYGDRRFMGRRKTHFTDDYGSPQVRNSRVIDPYDTAIESIGDYLDLYDALDNAGLTERQRQAIDLVYFESMTQEEAAEVIGVGQDVVSRRITTSLRKLRGYLTIN
ncbi:sigma-70 family RNA polymerase sigma factor [Bacillus idriensis]|uniref:Sigma-70 family RNA polymerase sigma factor n=1 Tax=Metabacillus idriensis TaxID=324768 RepID=A0A6I2MBJ6_9BACI|nr:sigma-70 family RNA polymerase sigma factor [Metabacillus idriensis]MRX54687.1 sigma-70 family RNA polymerase sigma factor [Metabacillus idriensis]